MDNIKNTVDDNLTAVGLAVVLSNDYKSSPAYPNLLGTEKDGDAMADSLKQLNYAVARKHNVSSTYLVLMLSKIGQQISFPPSYKRIVFVFAGHGEQEGRLIMSEGRTITVAGIIRLLSPTQENSITSQLGSMARLFFIDACRGTNDDKGLMVHARGPSAVVGELPSSQCSRGGKVVEQLRIPSEPNNIVVAYSTVSGYRSYEIEGEGGIWLQRLAKQIVQCDLPIGEVLIKVNEELSKLWQSANIKFIMNPETINRLKETVNFYKEKDVKVPQSAAASLPPSIVCIQKKKAPTVHLAANFSILEPSISGTCRPTPPQEQDVKLIPQPTQTRNPDLVLCRNGVVQQIGFYRSKLNEYKMKGIVEQYSTKTDCKGLSTRAVITCKLSNGQEIVGDSIDYYTGRKAVSEEKAAEDALRKIDSLIPAQTTTGPSAAAAVGVTTSCSQKSEKKIYKGQLNNLLIQKLKLGSPDYCSDQDSGGYFQCTVSHQLFGAVTGSKFLTKKEAENSAAWRALLSIRSIKLS